MLSILPWIQYDHISTNNNYIVVRVVLVTGWIEISFTISSWRSFLEPFFETRYTYYGYSVPESLSWQYAGDHADVGSVRAFALKRGRSLLIRIPMTAIFSRMTSNLGIKIRNTPPLHSTTVARLRQVMGPPLHDIQGTTNV